jgi:hypothetical protein
MEFGVTRMRGYKTIKFIISLREDVFAIFTYKKETLQMMPYDVKWYIDSISSKNEVKQLMIEMIEKADDVAYEIMRRMQ